MAASSLTSLAPAEPTVLDGLSEAQREAVLHGEGPLLIVAGAGTGKTTVLTRRIAYSSRRKRARPEEILALTFTEKAAVEMEERVDVLVPYGYAGRCDRDVPRLRRPAAARARARAGAARPTSAC